MPCDIFINGGLFETRLALVQQDRLTECLHLPFGAGNGFQPPARPMAGALCIGKVQRIAPEMDAAFIDIGGEEDGFLPAAAIERSDASISISRLVTEGQMLAVQIIKPSYDGKGPRLSSRLSVEQKAISAPHLPPQAGKSIQIGVVKASQPGLADALSALIGSDQPGAIIIDHPAAFSRLMADLPASLQSSLERAGTGDLFASQGLDEQIEAALEPVQALQGGGSLIIEPTSALTTVDVNSGGMGGSKLRFRLNLEAARAIPPAIRLRGIGGQVVIDFLPVRAPKQREAVMTALKQACQPDPAQIKISRITTGGLVALTRERRGLSLAAQMNSTPARPIRAKPSPASEAHKLLRALASEAAQPGSRQFQIKAGLKIIDWLHSRDDFHLAVQREFGINLALTADESLETDQWTLTRA